MAGLASAFVFVAGAVTLTYDCQVRGSGFQDELAGVHGPELMILGGGLILLTVAAFVVVSVLAGQASGGSKLHELVQRARQVDVSDPEALKELDALPDLRDMVAELVTEKAHARELSDRLEGLRREVEGVVEGMRRSADDGGHLREEGSHSNLVQLSVLWNGLVDRVRDMKEASQAQAPSANVQRDVAMPEIAGLVARLDELESELSRLRSAVATPATGSLGPSQWQEPGIEPASASPAPVSSPAAPHGWGEIEVAESSETLGWNPPPEPAPQAVEEPTRPARELFLDDDTFGQVEGYVEVASEPDTGPREAPRMDPFAPQSLLPNGLGETSAPNTPTPGKAQRGPAVTPPPAPAQRASAPQPGVRATSDPAAVAEGMRFPAFVGGAGKPVQGRVELTYENQDPEEVVELPASALLFENNPDATDGQAPSEEAVFDLRSLGATEFDQ